MSGVLLVVLYSSQVVPGIMTFIFYGIHLAEKYLYVTPSFGSVGMPLDPLEIGLAILFIILGLFIVVFVVQALFMLIPAAVVAVIVYFLTGSPLYTGIAFLVIVAISLLKKL